MTAPVAHQQVLQLHRSPGCIVVNKPHGVPFHATADHSGLLHLIREQQGSEWLPYEGPLHPVHRLDSICSGALVLGTSSEAAGELVSLFRQRKVQKYYVALSERRPSKKMGSVVGDMQKGRRGSWMLARTSKSPATTRFASVGVAPAAEELRVTIDGSDEAAVEMLTTADDGEAAEAADDGKPTETAEAAEAAPADVEATEGAGAAAAASPADDPLAAGAAEAPQDAGEAEAAEPEQQGGHVQLPAAEAAERHREAEGEGEEQQEEAGQQQAGRQRPALRAFLLKPETGRTHQLRVALKSLGAPVLGDERYALKTTAAQVDRGYLHCAALRFQMRGAAPVQVVCAPTAGRHFTTDAFQAQFAAWFPPGMEDDAGIWFSDSKLLRSEVAAGWAADAAADAEAVTELLEELC
ncbi:RNA pseudouridine synthase [Micractinium conductrix]|uniref:RNA pseudouridine synthase n=1 Tax=Micractinium conductrix TaxID=554055 RepID=A0A2P6VSG9_9CHLO|nr:RNA pseudouridine synthase [Micractinium conductrix]|eukprot:PSC77043.1 RNA pseudouridine synthase [Micractinium conductrix]